jgi:hypothetical protein
MIMMLKNKEDFMVRCWLEQKFGIELSLDYYSVTNQSRIKEEIYARTMHRMRGVAPPKITCVNWDLPF